MPIISDKYVSPQWNNNNPPAIDSTELNAISSTLEKALTEYKEPWNKIQSYTTAGSYVWTAPDLFNGKQYKIGIAIIGGGGSGGTGWSARSDTNKSAVGGASGEMKCFSMLVTPGKKYNVVVGRGGASITTGTSDNGGGETSGSTGGSSSFNGIISVGGQGGTVSTNNPQGGQPYALGQNSYNLYGGKMIPDVVRDYWKCLNIFEGIFMLGAGGNIQAWQNTYSTKGGKSEITGLGGGNGVVQSGNVPSDIYAESATEAGSGGGACGSYTGSTSNVTRLHSGAGMDGSVTIYLGGVVL